MERRKRSKHGSISEKEMNIVHLVHFGIKIKMVDFGAEDCVEVPFCPLKKLLQRIDKELDR